MEIGLLVLRVALGLILAAHGAQKLFGWFGGYGLAGTGGYFESIGFRPGKVPPNLIRKMHGDSLRAAERRRRVN